MFPASAPIQADSPIKKAGLMTLANIFSRKPSFEEGVKAEIPTLYRVARRILPHSVEEAEDAVGQTLLKAFKSQDQFNGEYLRSWLITILRNEIRNRHRYHSVRPVEVEYDGDYADEGLWSTVSAGLDREAILRELDKLDEDFRWAIQLCDVEGLSYEEAAAVMDVPIGTIRSRLFRARAKLRDRLAGALLAEDRR